MGQGRVRGHPGGIAGLAELIGAHAGAVGADLHRYHGLRLADINTPRCSWGELRDYLAHLPSDAALWQALDSPRQWGWTEHLLSAVEFRGAAANWQRAGKGRRPKPIPAPGETAKTRQFGTAVSVDEMRRLLDNWDEEEVTDVD